MFASPAWLGELKGAVSPGYEKERKVQYKISQTEIFKMKWVRVQE